MKTNISIPHLAGGIFPRVKILLTRVLPLVVIPFTTALGAPGDLDATFGTGGMAITSIGSYDQARGMARQPNGKIVVVGEAYVGNHYEFAVVLYNADGSLDNTFSGDGKLTTQVGNNGGRGACAVAIQSDGKIVVAGQAYNGTNMDFAVVRYNSDGSLDTDFFGVGIVITAVSSGNDYASGVVIQSDGKIVVGGHASNSFAAVRYNANGSIDNSFSGDGKVIFSVGVGGRSGASKIALQSDGKIVAAGYSYNGIGNDMAAIRLNPDGSLDTSFSGDGQVITPVGSYSSANSVAVQKDGRIILVGGSKNDSNNEDFAVVRYNMDGSLDSGFSGDGMVTTPVGSRDDWASSVALAPDGKIVVVGYSKSADVDWPIFAVVRYLPDGSLDTTFSGDGKLTTQVRNGSQTDSASAVTIDPDGKIIVAGVSYDGGSPSQYGDFAVLRYEGDPDTDNDGLPDYAETNTGVFVSSTNTGSNPNLPDTDGDGLNDGDEVWKYGCNPNIRDSDGDGFDDGFEVSTGFNPASSASTPESYSEMMTAVEFRFNTVGGQSYKIESSTDLKTWTSTETGIAGIGGTVTRFYSIQSIPKRYFRARRE